MTGDSEQAADETAGGSSDGVSGTGGSSGGDADADKTPDAAAAADGSSKAGLCLLHLDGEGARAALRNYVSEVSRPLDVVGVDDVRAAVEELRTRAVDCLVVEPATVDDWPWFYRAARRETPAPLVLYTLLEPEAVDANAVAAADTIVQKGQEAHRAFLFEKVDSLLETDDGHPTHGLGSGEFCVFALDERGRVRDRYGDPEATFGPAWTAAGTAETRLHERLAAGLGNGAAYRRRMDGAIAADEAVEGLPCEIPDATGTDVLTCHSVPVETDGPVERVDVYRDVTDVASRLADSERASRMVKEVTDGMYMLDADGTYTYVNESYADLVGYDREELLGKHASILMSEGDLQDGQAIVQEVLSGKRAQGGGDVELQRKDGGTISVGVNFTPLEEGDTYEGIVGVARDITERRRRERQLLQYRTLVEAAGDPMYVLDTDGFVELHNSAMAAWCDGDPDADLEGRHASDVTSDKGYRKGTAAVRKLLADEDRSWVRYETDERSHDGEERVYEVTVGLITDEDGEHVGSVGTFRDVTERRLREEELDLLKQILTRVLRHNIRNRANVIEGHANLLANRLDGRDGELAETIVEKCRDLVETSEKVRTVERVIDGEGVRVEHDLERVLEDTVDAVLASHPGTDIRLDVPTGLRVEAVPKLRVAFRNLLENAVEHGREAATAERDVEPEAYTTVHLAAEGDRDRVRVAVEDDGPGIPDSEIEVLERSRETALEHSRGMGLWLVNWVVEKSGGELTFQREDGTTAIVSLPVP